MHFIILTAFCLTSMYLPIYKYLLVFHHLSMRDVRWEYTRYIRTAPNSKKGNNIANSAGNAVSFFLSGGNPRTLNISYRARVRNTDASIT